jgi:hypothetical protein
MHQQKTFSLGATSWYNLTALANLKHPPASGSKQLNQETTKKSDGTLVLLDRSCTSKNSPVQLYEPGPQQHLLTCLFKFFFALFSLGFCINSLKNPFPSTKKLSQE